MRLRSLALPGLAVAALGQCAPNCAPPAPPPPVETTTTSPVTEPPPPSSTTSTSSPAAAETSTTVQVTTTTAAAEVCVDPATTLWHDEHTGEGGQPIWVWYAMIGDIGPAPIGWSDPGGCIHRYEYWDE